MYICICNAVKEKDIVEEIKKGNSTQEIIDKTCVGKVCGRCNSAFYELYQKEKIVEEK
tara:strand:- start:518 stop:691 length:174 start_codon:yes stop_codon:yes gene_type:complete